MRRAQGNAEVKLLECVNPVKDKWRVRWDVQQRDDGSADYMEEEFSHRPETNEIHNLIIGWYNNQVDEAILSGFTYEGNAVWLSTENQFNYKSAYDLAVQTGGASLPVTFKFGTDDVPVYRTFEDLAQFADFYTKAMAYIQTTLANGWKAKDMVDWKKYE